MNDDMAYIGRCPECGNTAAAAVDSKERDRLTVANNVRDMVRTGLIAERVPVDVVRREGMKRCSCLGPWEEDHAAFALALIEEAYRVLDEPPEGSFLGDLYDAKMCVDSAIEALQETVDQRETAEEEHLCKSGGREGGLNDWGCRHSRSGRLLLHRNRCLD